MTSSAERAALSFGILCGYLVGAILAYADASVVLWMGLIAFQLMIVIHRMWAAFR